MAKVIHSKTGSSNRADFATSLQHSAVGSKAVLGVTDSVAAQLGAAAAGQAIALDTAWTEAEQRALEKGLKTYPSSLKEERWCKIAENLPNRTPEDCRKRFKAIAKALKVRCKQCVDWRYLNCNKYVA